MHDDDSGLDDLEELRNANSPIDRRLLVRVLHKKMDRPLAEIVDMIFANCITEQDFAGEALRWVEAISQFDTQDPNWAAKDLQKWAMKRRGLLD